MKLSVVERIGLLNILPAEGDLTTIKLVRQARENLSFSDDEHKALELRVEGKQVFWNADAEVEKDIQLGAKVEAMIIDTLQELDKQRKLTEAHLSLCEKFGVA